MLKEYQIETNPENMQTPYLDEALKILTMDERFIIKLRFGFFGGTFTLEEVGKIYGVSKERIRQWEAKALRKLRDPEIIKILNGKEE